jgi:hypothetical protein
MPNQMGTKAFDEQPVGRTLTHEYMASVPWRNRLSLLDVQDFPQESGAAKAMTLM